MPNIRQNVTSQVAVEVYSTAPQDEAKDPLLASSIRPGPAWYRGDLHMHTAHSDGSCKSRLGQKSSLPPF